VDIGESFYKFLEHVATFTGTDIRPRESFTNTRNSTNIRQNLNSFPGRYILGPGEVFSEKISVT
jgi:hypothetical protein